MIRQNSSAPGLPETTPRPRRFRYHSRKAASVDAAMAPPKPEQPFDFDAYMAWEETQEERHEFVAGEVFAMSGGSDAHYTILGNTYSLLKAALRGSRCRAFIAGMKLHIEAADAALYPDVFATCDSRDDAASASHAKGHACAAMNQSRRLPPNEKVDRRTR